MKKSVTISDSLVINQELASRRDNLRMDYYLKKYLDHNIIGEHAINLELDINDVPEHDQTNLIDLMIKNDPITKEAVLDRAHELIQARLESLKWNQKLESGYKPKIDNQTGEMFWISPNGRGL